MSDDSYKIEVFVFPDGTLSGDDRFDEARRVAARLRRPRPPTPASAQGGASSRRRRRRRAASAPAAQGREGRAQLPRLRQRLSCTPSTGSAPATPSWNLRLRCPECETRREVTLGRASVEEFNRELYDGAQAIARECDLMTRRNFEEEAERIVAALEGDLIQPMDF